MDVVLDVGDPIEGFHGFDQLEGGRLMFTLIGIPFLFLGLVMLIAHFWIRRWTKQSSE